MALPPPTTSDLPTLAGQAGRILRPRHEALPAGDTQGFIEVDGMGPLLLLLYQHIAT